MTTLIDFYTLLEQQDWYYAKSDDHWVWEEGNRKEENLRAISRESGKHRELYKGFTAWKFSGDHWGTPQQVKPVLPIEKVEVKITWLPEDIATLRPDWSLEQCTEALSGLRKPLQGCSIEFGWGLIEQLLEK